MMLQTKLKAKAPIQSPVNAGILQRKCACNSLSANDGEHEEGQKRMMLQRNSTNQTETSKVPTIVHDVLRSPGEPLDSETRAFMEPRFGHDFSKVRVHADSKAAESARAVNALAYTVGQDVVFGTGQYSPTTDEGYRLIAHELVHTIQQNGILNYSSDTMQEANCNIPSRDYIQRVSSISIEDTNNMLEREAEVVADRLLNYQFVSLPIHSRALSALSSPSLQRRTIQENYATAANENGPIWDILLTIKNVPDEDSESKEDFINACMDGVRDAVASLGRGEKVRSHNIHVMMNYHQHFDYVTISNQAFNAAQQSVLGEKRAPSKQPVAQLPSKVPDTPSTASLQPQVPKTIIVIGSPSRGQAYQLQFVTAGMCQSRDINTTWLIERTGYEIYGLPLSSITDQAPPGGYGWITPSASLVGWLNSMPDGSIGRLIVYSHGVPGNVALRYGWSDIGSPDYGLNIKDVASMNRKKFTADATIEFNSCNTGTSTDEGNLAQEVANQIDRPVSAWTGRTSYAGINRGTCSIGPSTITSLSEFFVEGYSRLKGRTPRLETFQPSLESAQ